MLYINPRTVTKEQWLTEHALPITPAEAKNWDFEAHPDEYPVAHVDNGDFTAAGVAPDAAELSRWFSPDDDRERHFFRVKKELFFELHPEYKDVV